MEIENKYASKGVAGSGLGLGIAGTALGVLNGAANLVGAMNANRSCDRPAPAATPVAVGMCNEIMPVTRYDAAQSAKISELEMQLALRDANIFTDGKMNDLRNYVDAKFAAVNDKLAEQAVYNGVNTATLGCMQNQIAQLLGLTKLVVPNTSVCPGWGNVTITPAAAAAAGA